MRIGLNGQMLLRENPAGPEKYTSNLIRALAEIDHNNTYVIYLEKEPPEGFLHELTGSNPNFSYKVVARGISWTHWGLGLEIAKNPAAILFCATHTMPFWGFIKTPIVSMIHDSDYKYQPGYKGLYKRLMLPVQLWYVLIFSKATIAPSQAVKDKILRKMPGVSPAKISVIHEGVGRDYYKRSEGEVAAVRTKYHLGNDDYLIFISTIQPRKNIPGLVEGFSLALSETPTLRGTKLVIVGKNGWDYEESLQAPRKFGVEGNVVFVGRIPDSDKPALLSGARAYVSASFEEGFGLPLLEAMACECSALVSDIPAYREIGRDYANYFDPRNAEDTKENITKALLTPADDTKLQAAKEWAQSFSWDNTAKKTLGVFKQILPK